MRKPILLLVLLVLVAAGVLLWLRSGHEIKPPAEVTEAESAPVVARSPTPVSLTNESEPPEVVLTFPADPRPAVQKFYEFARAANLYRFDPRVIHYFEETNRFGTDISFQTPTHGVQVLNGKVLHVISNMDSANAPHDREGKGIAAWHSCTGTMTEEEALAATMAILQAINDTRTMEAVQKGKRTFEAIPIHVKDPNGNRVRVIPFRTIRLYDERRVLCVRAQFRMGETGSAGLVDWFNNR
ncbi:MAG: hypothetical protein HZA90_14120 [Verrucomicrobia bacterium]|nr:hypothetical protein [Verrucomicrobiota bacterium]